MRLAYNNLELENYEKKYSNKSLKRNGYCCYGGK
jgi:hypothetical protein